MTESQAAAHRLQGKTSPSFGTVARDHLLALGKAGGILLATAGGAVIGGAAGMAVDFAATGNIHWGLVHIAAASAGAAAGAVLCLDGVRAFTQARQARAR